MKKVKANLEYCDSPERKNKRIPVNNQYLMTNNVAMPIGNSQLHKQLPSGCYEMHYTNSGISFELTDMDTDDLLKFEDPTHKTILSEMDDFWNKKQKYKDMGYLHNRAILMFGPPGSGKSCLIKLATADLIKKGDIVFVGKNISLLSEGLKSFREVEPDRRCLAIMEDIDELGEHSLLQLLDGGNTVDNIVYLGTTNYVDRLPDRVLRPGRFDRKILVSHPPATGRKAYFKAKLKESLDETAIANLVKATEGFSFGHLRELVTSVFCLGQNIDSVLKRLSGSGLEKTVVASIKEIPKNKLDQIKLEVGKEKHMKKHMKNNMKKNRRMKSSTLLAALKEILSRDVRGTDPGEKDIKRLQDIKAKGGTDTNKIITLCQNMANSIARGSSADSREKAMRRASAAEIVFPGAFGKMLSKIFKDAV